MFFLSLAAASGTALMKYDNLSQLRWKKHLGNLRLPKQDPVFPVFPEQKQVTVGLLGPPGEKFPRGGLCEMQRWRKTVCFKWLRPLLHRNAVREMDQRLLAIYRPFQSSEYVRITHLHNCGMWNQSREHGSAHSPEMNRLSPGACPRTPAATRSL